MLCLDRKQTVLSWQKTNLPKASEFNSAVHPPRFARRAFSVLIYPTRFNFVRCVYREYEMCNTFTAKGSLDLLCYFWYVYLYLFARRFEVYWTYQVKAYTRYNPYKFFPWNWSIGLSCRDYLPPAMSEKIKTYTLSPWTNGSPQEKFTQLWYF